MFDANAAHDAIKALLGDRVLAELSTEGRQALFSAACMIAFCDRDLADGELACIQALDRLLGVEGSGKRVTTKRLGRDQVIATFRGAKLAPESADAVVSCLAFVAKADGKVVVEEQRLIEELGGALGRDAAACAAIVERVAAPG